MNESIQNDKPFWMTFTLDDSNLDTQLTVQSDKQLQRPYSQTDPNTETITQPMLGITLRSGRPIFNAVTAMIALGVEAILFNSRQLEVMLVTPQVTKDGINREGGKQRLRVYVNAYTL